MLHEPVPYLSVCSGIEAFSVAVRDLDFQARAFAEIEDFPSRVLGYRFPSVPNLGDMTAINTSELGHVGWLVGGTPCQSFSIAGMRAGLNDDRGNLTLEFVKLAHRLADENGLRGLLWENVPGCLSDKTNAFGCFLGALVGHDGPLYPGDKPAYGKSSRFWTWIRPREKEPVYDDEGEPTGEFTIATEGYHRAKWPDIGMAAGPRARAAWRILDSRYFGVPQRRRRVFVVADFGTGPDPAAVLFEPRGERRSAAQGRQAGEGIAGTLGGSSQSGGFPTTDLDNNGAFVPVAPTLRAGGNKTGGHRPPGSDVDTVETLVVMPPVSQMNSRTGNERDEVERLVAYVGNAEDGNPDAPSLNASNGKKGINNQTGLVMVFDPNQMTNPTNRSQPEAEVSHTMPATEQGPVLFSVTPSNSNRDYNAREKDYAQALDTAGGGPSARGGDMVISFNPKAAGKQTTLGANKETVSTLGASVEPAVAFMPELGTDQASALRSADGGSSAPMAMAGMQVRRLTPTECERLQGFPDGWTLVPGLSGWRAVGDDDDIDDLRSAGLTVKVNKKTGRARVNDPDGPRYKSLGNSFTTEPINWIMSRVQASLRGEPMPDWQPMRLWGNGRG